MHRRQWNWRLPFQHHPRSHPAYRVARRAITTVARHEENTDLALGICRNLLPQLLLQALRIDRIHPSIRPALAPDLPDLSKTP